MAANNLPPIPQDEIKENPRWREWFRNLGTYIQQAQSGNTIWSIIQGGTGANNAPAARSNLGLGDMATQNSNNVNITGGTISGVPGFYQVQSDWTETNTSNVAYIKHKPTLGTMAAQNVGITRTITTAKLTTGGTNGSMTFTNGILTASTQAT
jgi:hypothetical protein